MSRSTEIRAALDARFDARVAEAQVYLSGRRWPTDWPPPRLPRLVRETLVWAARLDGGASLEALARCYCDELPTAFVAQLLGGDDPTVSLLWEPLDAAGAPRLAGTLDGMARALAAAGVAPATHLGRAWPLSGRESVASLYTATVFGGGTPMLSAGEATRERMWEAVRGGADPVRTIDAALAAGLAHELAHGVAGHSGDGGTEAPPPPWMVTEAATILLHHRGAPRQVVPREPAEAVPGTALYLLYGLVLARLFGADRVLRSLRGALTLEEAFGARVGRILRVLGWQELAPRLATPPLYPDGLAAETWARVTALAVASTVSVPALEAAAAVPASCPEGALAVDDLARAVATVPWAASGWWGEAPTPLDEELFEVALASLFIGHRLVDGLVEAVPARVPGDVVRLDATLCRAEVGQRPTGDAFGPGRALIPPPIARRLAESGRAQLELRDVGPDDIVARARALLATLT